MMRSTRPEPPREAALVEAARKRARLSVREAARGSGIGEARWRQIVTGYESKGKGVYKEVRAPDDTLARMAQTVGVTPDQLAAVGRSDAAKVLEEITPDPQPGNVPVPLEAVYQIMASLPPETQAEVIRRLGYDLPAPREEGNGQHRHAG